MPDRSNSTLTPRQRQELERLLAAGCLDHASAKNITEPGLRGLNCNVLGILCDKGLTDKRVRSKRGHAMMAYWLTPSGVDMARQLRAAARG